MQRNTLSKWLYFEIHLTKIFLQHFVNFSFSDWLCIIYSLKVKFTYLLIKKIVSKIYFILRVDVFFYLNVLSRLKKKIVTPIAKHYWNNIGYIFYGMDTICMKWCSNISILVSDRITRLYRLLLPIGSIYFSRGSVWP